MTAAKDRVLAGVPGHVDAPPVVLMTVFSPSAPMPPGPPIGDRYGDDDSLGFRPVNR